MNINTAFLPQVSVIIPIYNGVEDLLRLMECIESQTYPKELVNYIIVNNNSQDKTAFFLDTFQKKSRRESINLTTLEENDIQSSYAARNQGIKIAQGEIIAFTDADCRPEPDWLYNLIQPFRDENIGIVAGEILALTGDSILEQYAEKQQILSQKHTLENKFLPYGQTANLAIRKTIFQEVGIFRPYLTTGGDADICWRVLQQTNYKIHLAENAIVKHRHRSTLEEYKKQWQRYGKSNKYLHQIHNIPLNSELSLKEYLYIFIRWLIKELPVNSMKKIVKKATIIDIVETPLSLLGTFWRSQGQKTATLPEKAREIDKI
jgi:cellulose synthase/poly-beta-1,6-N-acetylglucosamine synthase-like glycosyltransferase